MNDKIEELAIKAKIQMVSEPRLQEFADLIVLACIDAVRNTGTHCALTTYDLGVVTCTIQRSVKTLEQTFNIKKTYDYK
jgi:hypothetical protein